MYNQIRNLPMIILGKDQVREPLYAIVPVFNYMRWKSRWKHAERAIKHFHDSGATIVLVEVAFNRRDFVFADSGLDGTPANCGILGTDNRFRHKYIGLRSSEELWLKENCVSIGVQSLPHDWNQVCWLDSDIHFGRPNWVGEAIHKLQHGGANDIAFLQMFSQAQDLGPNYEMLPQGYPHASGIGFVEAWKRGIVKTSLSPEIEQDLKDIGGDLEKLKSDFLKLEEDLDNGYYLQSKDHRVWPGLAWACTKPAWEAVGGLIDWAVWGGADYHMSYALIEKTEGMMRNDLHRNYKKLVNQWYQRCRTHIRRNVLVMDGVLFHHWHGRKEGRGYNSKHSLLAKYGFDPLRHLTRDSHGLYQLHDDRSTAFVQIRDAMRRISVERNEDVNEAFRPGEQGH